MKPRYRILIVTLFAVIVAIASLPVAFVAADSVFGMASTLVVPLLFVAIALTLTARDLTRRLWWFVFSCSTAIWMVLLSWLLERAVHTTALYLQDLTQQGTISLSQRVIEPTSLALIFLGPPLGAVITGIVSARWLVKNCRTIRHRDELVRQWRFSMREMLVAVFAISLLLAFVFGRTQAHRASESRARNTFLARFESSFAGTAVQLADAPVITGGHRNLIPESGYVSFMAPGQNEYRVTAPVFRNNTRLWAVWSYTCNGDHNDMIYRFAHAEAPTEGQLPSHPFPAKAYVNATWKMIDGVPQ
jgi:hypothetical protein